MVRSREPRVSVGVVPMLADNYQRRSDLDIVRTPSHRGNPTNTYVVCGMGGVGKSQFAAEYARSIEGEVDLVVWVTAVDREAVVDAYARAWERVGHPGTRGAEVAADRFLNWLRTADQQWLIVLDDVRDPKDLRNLWPDGPSGRTVVTTRRADNIMVERGRQKIQVGPFTPDQARAYLAGKLVSRSESAQDVDLLAEALGRLPLALAQAASFMLDRRVSCVDYLRRFTRGRMELPELFPPEAFADEYQLTVATTWSMSIKAADRLGPRGLCERLMHIAALLDPSGFPRGIVETSAVVGYSSGASVDECRDALANLARFSLVELQDDAEPQSVRVHSMVQRVVLSGLSRSRLVKAASAAVNGLVELWPDIEVDAEFSRMLRANTAVLAGHPDDLMWYARGYGLLRRAGRSLGEFGLLRAELTHWTFMVDATKRLSTTDVSPTLVLRQALARARGLAGDPARAAAEFEALVPEHVHVFGAANPYTFDARHGLAWWRGEDRSPAEAVREFQVLLEDLARERGMNHPQTLRTRYALGRWRGQAGDPRQARADFADLLSDIHRVLSLDDPLALAVRHDLAWWKGEAGNPTTAAALFSALLEDRLRVLGERHLHTLATRHDLAWWYGEAGEPEAAAGALEGVFRDDLRLLGPDHPHTMATREDVTWWRADAEARLAGGPQGQSRDHAGRVMGDLPGLDFLEVDGWDVILPGEDHP
ncbi:NB-ARC domain-containing protein [Umezawaea sp. NPDC059074]|uniref:NB-ARC domain-containing protein n=1 Tax=Umezawaea sp. NPDC059074 TaxID=3346716 RepID=UPI0036B80092